MASLIHSDRRTADRRLSQYFNTKRDTFVEMVKAAVAARARCTADNARSAPGYYAWDAATSRGRQVLRREGWDGGDHDGIEVIVNHDLKKMIAVMNTDEGTANVGRSPRNRTPKGPATSKVVDLNNQYELFRESDVGPSVEAPYSLWYLCIFDDGTHVRAELSRPSEYCGNAVVKFSERIFILSDGEWERVLLDPQGQEPGDEIQINVRRL